MLKRQEYKYFISQNEIHILRRSLKKFMKIDENSNKINSSYTVTSLYFDTPYESNFNEKVDGIISREKFRIRKYSTSDIIKFESKKKNENVILKQSEKIDVNYSEKIINGNYDFFDKKISKFLKHSFVKLRSNCYKAKNIVEYDREAYTLPYGNTRITIDKNLRTYQIRNSINTVFFSNEHIPVLVERGDRRFNIIKTGGNLSKLDWFKPIPVFEKIKSELTSFAQYLWNINVNYENANTVMENDAKNALIEIGQNMYEEFATHLKKNNVDWFKPVTEALGVSNFE